jgi:hypothetical protein
VVSSSSSSSGSGSGSGGGGGVGGGGGSSSSSSSSSSSCCSCCSRWQAAAGWAHLRHAHLLGHLEGQLAARGAQQVLRAQVGRHDDHRVGEVDGAALAVRQAAIIQDGQQHVEDLRGGW